MLVTEVYAPTETNTQRLGLRAGKRSETKYGRRTKITFFIM